MKIRDILLTISLILSVFLTLDYIKRDFISDPLNAQQIKAIKAITGNNNKEKITGNKELNEVIKKFADSLFNQSEDPFIGKIDAKHKIVAFIDPYCGACKKATSELNALVEKRSDIKVIFKPVAMISQESEEASRELIAAHKQQKFLTYMEALEKSAAANQDERMDLAKDAGVDIKQIMTDADSSDARKTIKDNMFLSDKLQIRSIPSIIIGNELHAGAISKDDLESLVDESIKSGD